MTLIRAKTWIFRTQAIAFGTLSAFGLVFGPLFLIGYIKPAHGGSGVGAGVALTISGVIFAPILALALFNIYARRKPLIALVEGGIEINSIGASALDGVPFIPGYVRVAWSIVTGQGFRSQMLRIPLNSLTDASIQGFSMARVLAIRFTQASDKSKHVIHELHFPEHVFCQPIDTVAAAIRSYIHAKRE
jgi:hypothetical protein